MGEDFPLIKRKLKSIPPVRLIAVSFLIVIFVGTVLLMLPVAARSGRATPFLDSLFTSTSAVCVTGLILFDTWSHWALFGQIVILALIQVGGLGVVTFTTGFSLLLRRRLGLRDIRLATENTGGSPVNIVHLLKMILGFTFSCELAGALLLMLRFVPQFGSYGIWVSVFTAISAYCNAGFDIMGFFMPGGSLGAYAGDPLVCLTVCAMVVTGGIGFVVISDIYSSKIKPSLHRRRPVVLNFHSQIVLRTTVALIFVGTLLIFITEYSSTMRFFDFGTRINTSLFQSIAARTAGFATIDISGEHDITKIITIILMFIGASPASTGGGIKTTTFVVLAAAVLSVMRGSDEAVVLKRRLDKFTVYRALSILTVGFLVVLSTAGVIMATSPSVNGIDALFEAASAFGTVGLSANVTPMLTPVSRITVILAMYIGRVGPVSLGLAFTLRKGRGNSSAVLPEGKIVVG